MIDGAGGIAHCRRAGIGKEESGHPMRERALSGHAALLGGAIESPQRFARRLDVSRHGAAEQRARKRNSGARESLICSLAEQVQSLLAVGFDANAFEIELRQLKSCDRVAAASG